MAQGTVEPLELTVGGAIKASDTYYLVKIPTNGSVTVTITGSGALPPLTEADKCTCAGKKTNPTTDGAATYTFSIGKGEQSANLGNKVTLTVNPETEPGEYEYQLTKKEQKYKCSNPAASGGVSGGAKTNDQASDKIKILVCKIETESTRPVPEGPDDKKRKIFGIGEHVQLTFLPSKDVRWTVDEGGGKFLSNDASSVPFQIGVRAKTIKITATIEGKSIDTTFRSIFPTQIEATKDNNASHSTGHGVAALVTKWKIMPTTVSFGGVKIEELPCPAKDVTGYYLTHFNANDLDHDPRGGARTIDNDNVVDDVDTAGWQLRLTDPPLPTPFTYGYFDWTIPVQFVLADDDTQKVVPFWITQQFILSSSGILTMKKLGKQVP
ncbi:hypothetical protein DB346_10165 [Verrucomicrobia bacterium LW23]|nr:hypothetical protein DB346_10165 [Verrucomicrobia bacterium LW23]